MTDDTHDQLMVAVLNYLKESENFERRPSERSKRAVRRELRNITALVKTRHHEVQRKYNDLLEEIRASGKWESNRHKHLSKSKKKPKADKSDT